jgi:hypothetical protein
MITEWPNKLGYDIEDAEVWKYRECFRVFTRTRVLKVPYSVTTNPETALTICREQGLSRAALDDMDPRDAEALFQATVITQRELF